MITYLCTWQSGAPMRLEMNQGKYYKKKRVSYQNLDHTELQNFLNE